MVCCFTAATACAASSSGNGTNELKPCPDCCCEAAAAANHSHTNSPVASATPARLKFEPRTAWLEPGERHRTLPADARVTTQDGKPLQFSELAGQPMAMSFIYTRCENPLKCARVTKTMARLQTELHRAGLADQVRLCLVSYDPEYDTPARMTEYAMKLGYRLDSQNLMIQLEPRARDRFFEKLNVAVNFNSSGVNVHGIQLMLFGRAGRFARAYHTLIWDNAQVLADLERLAGEENTAAEVD